MKQYLVKLISKDNHKYELHIEANDIFDVEKLALKKIVDIGYDIYEYKVVSIDEVI